MWATAVKRLNPFWIILLVFFGIASLYRWQYLRSDEAGARHPMKTYFLGRFSIAIPALLEQKIRYSKLRCVEISETVWPRTTNPEESTTAEWKLFITKVRALQPPEGKVTAIIREQDFLVNGKTAKGIFYYSDNYDKIAAQWTLSMSSGQNSFLLVGDPSVVEKELVSKKMNRNIQNIASAYQPLDLQSNAGPRSGNRFYLEHGVINLPYLEQEESCVRFEGHPLDLKLFIEMYMDFAQNVEDTSLINGTRAMLVASLLIPGSGISKIRLGNRQVAGMPGEEAVLRIREGDSKNLLFQWHFNGKNDSGEYPTTHIEMESPDGHLDEKLRIWDAILDSMKPMFVRKK